MKIVIDEKIPFIRGVFEPWADVVYSPGSKIDSRMISDADALIIRTRTKCNPGLLDGSSVRIVASATIGFDHIDTEWLEKKGIKWANAPGCNSGSVMQYITSLLFFLSRKHALDLRSLTLGIAGVGNVGSKVERAARALGMKVLLNDPPRLRREGGTEFHPLEKLLAEADILTMHVPLTLEGEDRTFHLLGDHNISAMKRNAILINSSRGEVVDNKALRHALGQGLIRGAALDVWEGEPMTDPQLVALTDIATPHIAGYSVDGKANATINSVRVVAAELGIPLLHWAPAELPGPAEPLINLDERTDSGSPADAVNSDSPADAMNSGSPADAVNSSSPADAVNSGSSEIAGKAIINISGKKYGNSRNSSATGNSLDRVALAVNHTYRIEEDDSLFRKNREKFEYLRDNYRIRREFSSYSVRTSDPEAERIMTDLGFHIIE